MTRETVTILDEMDRPYVCEVEGTRVIRIISAPALEPDSLGFDVGHMNDVRFGE